MNITKPYKVLLGSFMPTNSKRKVAGNETNELISYYLWTYIDSGGLPEWSKVEVIRGDGPFNKDVEAVVLLATANDSNFPSKTDGIDKKIAYHNSIISKCRFLFLKRVIMEVDSDWYDTNVLEYEEPEEESQVDNCISWITNEHVQQITQQCISIKCWDDARVIENQRVLAIYIHLTKQISLMMNWRDIDMSSYVIRVNDMDGIDMLDNSLSYTDEFEMLEKLAWKAVTHPDYHDYIDKINLTKLKELLKDFKGRSFVPIGRQAEFLCNHKRFNSVAASRRAGKTLLAAYLIIRQLLLPNQVIAVIVPTLKNHARPIARYIQRYMGRDPGFNYDKKESVIKYTSDDAESEAIFYTSEREDSVRGESINFRVVDEAAMCGESIIYNSQATLASAQGWSYHISTVNQKTPKNHFYNDHVEAEIDMMDRESIYYARRVPIGENPFISDAEKKILMRQRDKDQKRYDAEYECIFQDGTGIDSSRFWIVDVDAATRECKLDDGRIINLRVSGKLFDGGISTYLYYIISHDGASKKDQPGLTVWGYSNGVMECVIAEYLKGCSYYDQVAIVNWLWKKLSGTDKIPKDNNKATRVIDYSGAGIAVAEIFKRESGTNPILVQWLGGVYEGAEGGVWRVGKELMINKFKGLIGSGHLKGFSFMKEYMVEMEKYDDNWTRKDGNHMDLFASGCMAIWYGEKMGMIHPDQTTPEERFFDDEFSRSDAPPEYYQTISQVQEDRYSMFGY